MITEKDINAYCESRGYDYDFTRLLDDEDRAELTAEVETFLKGGTVFDGILSSIGITLKYMGRQMSEASDPAAE